LDPWTDHNAVMPSPTDHPDSRLESVFKTDDPGLLPLATMALESAGIEHIVRNEGKVDSLDWAMSQPPTIRPRVVEILVTSDAAARARELLADLANSAAASAASAEVTTDAVIESEPPTVTLEDAATGTTIGQITESQLQEITSRLEEEASQQYRLTPDAVDDLEKAGVDAALVALLRQSVGPHDSGRLIRWVVR
jgi:hypothetical protein